MKNYPLLILRSLRYTAYSKLQRLWDLRLNATVPVKDQSSTLFRVYDFGNASRKRAKTFSCKEPETIRWIDKIDPTSDILLDIGANIGLFSLYAATKGVQVVAVEPDALNFALLNCNLRLNRQEERVLSYPFAIHESSVVSLLNITSSSWGGSCSSFHVQLDQNGKPLKRVHSHGVYGCSIDSLLPLLPFAPPSHLKIDVDGNELFVLKGALQYLKSASLKSILIELNEAHPDYSLCLDIIAANNFRLAERGGYYGTTCNYIFYR
jgi:FkbM family methyltransferase